MRLPLLFVRFAGLLTAAVAPALAQTALPVPRDVQALYAKGTRQADGRPGLTYWQNTADYALQVAFDPVTRLVAGTATISYRNNSPDSLRQLWFKLYPNLYQTGAPRNHVIQPEDVGEGVTIEQMSLNGRTVGNRKLVADGTNMPVPLYRPLGPGQTLRVVARYHYTLNKTSHQRTGEVTSGAAFVAYFFPRIAVYDDFEGWNKNPYNGEQEFYNDFGNFSADITVPQHFVVWATGDLTNAAQVLAPAVAQRLAAAETSDDVTNVIAPADANRRDLTAPNAQNTWHFEARNVTDFVFATADHYAWQASSLVVDPATGRRTRVDAAYDPRHRDYAEVIDFARKTVQAMSYTFPKWPFPYAHETVFDGLDQMEYPMMVNDNPVASHADAITLTDHEIFHSMFPFYMGINETRYGWMDEGWATLGEWLISGLIDPNLPPDDYGIGPYARYAGTADDLPILTPSTQLNGNPLFLNSYPKPALGYLYVKDLLGDELFTKALHTYIGNWQGRHPLPLDFFNSMNTGVGRNLNWFWQRWFYDGGYPDLAIQSVVKTTTGYDLLIANKGGKPVPIDLTLTLADGTTQKIHRTVAVWETTSSVTVPVPTQQALKTARLGSTWVPDSFAADNVWR